MRIVVSKSGIYGGFELLCLIHDAAMQLGSSLNDAASSLDAAAAAEAPLAENLSKFRIESLAILFDDIGAEASQFVVKKDLQFSIVA